MRVADRFFYAFKDQPELLTIEAMKHSEFWEEQKDMVNSVIAEIGW